MSVKLLNGKYKTWEGARKRCAFENSLAKHEFEQGYKAKLYRYSVVQQEGDTVPQPDAIWRVKREIAQ